MDTVDANTGNSRAVIFQNAGNDFVNGLRMATNLDFGMDYARNAAAYLENGNYVEAGIFEIGAALEVFLDLGVAYYGAGIFGGVVEGAKTALATGSLIQGYIQAERQVNQFTERFKADVSNVWNDVTAPVVNTWNSVTTSVSAAANKGIEGGKTTAKTDFYVTQDGTIIPSKSVKTNSNYPVMEIETKSGKAVKTKDVVSEWDNFLGSNQTNIDPFTGQISPDRIWSADGTRSIRFDDHEMNSMGTKNFHYHMEIWHDGYVENILQRIQK